MMRLSLCLCICLVLGLPAWPAAARNVIVVQPGSMTDYSGAPPIIPLVGDPVWNPTDEQLAAWALDGVNAAAADMYLADQPGVLSWIWAPDQPVALPEGRSLRFAALLTPQLVATTAGYAAAWDERWWGKVQADQANTLGELGARVNSAMRGSQLTWLVVLDAPDLIGWPTAPNATIYYKDRRWGSVRGATPTGMGDFVQDSFPLGASGDRWAGGYLLGQIADWPCLQKSDSLAIITYNWQLRPQQRVEWSSEMPEAPSLSPITTHFLAEQLVDLRPPLPDIARLLIGGSNHWAFADFSLPAE
jgi:hypothetical protein